MISDFLNTRFFRLFLTAMFFCFSNIIVFGQNKAENKIKTRDFCSNYNYSSNDKVSYKEMREVNLPAGNLINVDGGRNGGIQVKGENRSDVLVRACVQTMGATDAEARSMAENIRIETGSTIRAEGAGEEANAAVSYEILVPRRTNLKLLAHNGGISIGSVDGAIEFETVNGGVSLGDVAGDVRGKTRNGGVRVALSGNRWSGGGLDVETTNGGVSLSMPENYAAHIEARTVNGGFKSDIAGLKFPENENNGSRRKQISTDLNGGGAPVRVVTTNGGVRINSSAGGIL